MTGKKQDLIPLAMQAKKITFQALFFFSVKSFLSVNASAAGFDRV